MKKFLSYILAGLMLMLPALASEDISARVEQRLMNETAYISLYYPNSSLSVYGDLVFDELSGEVQLQSNGGESFSVTEISVENIADYADVYAAEDNGNDDSGDDESDSDALYVADGYVLLRVARANDEALLLCMSENYALSDEELAAQEEAELSELEDEEVLVPREEVAEDAAVESLEEFEAEAFDFTEETSEPTVTEFIPESSVTVSQSGSFLSIFNDFSMLDYILLIVALCLLLALILTLALLLPYKKRSDTIGLRYINLKSAYSNLKRENSRLKTEQLRLEGELVKERGKSLDAAMNKFL